jgi:hypothetical protein
VGLDTVYAFIVSSISKTPSNVWDILSNLGVPISVDSHVNVASLDILSMVIYGVKR